MLKVYLRQYEHFAHHGSIRFGPRLFDQKALFALRLDLQYCAIVLGPVASHLDHSAQTVEFDIVVRIVALRYAVIEIRNKAEDFVAIDNSFDRICEIRTVKLER